MFIREIIIEGFKSYATRTVISGWDPEFNAITGLNGSGKSNILDAICFVLGISNLSQVRAGTFQDLVYKRGQAGVTKASVTIEFDNSDPDNSPIGYKEHKTITVTRQIVIGGHNKYLINGHNAQQKMVSNLFQSVQLNVNNPHFLIMQGRITKVLNMKPPEILAMIEEAAGTRMFEDKKELAIKTIEKKDKKLQEIESLLKEEVTPKLETLRKERTALLELQKVETEIERLRRIVVALQYMSAMEKFNSSQQDFTGKTESIAALEEETASLKSEIKASEGQIARITAQREKEMGGQFEKLEKKLEKLGEQVVRVKTQCDAKQDDIKHEEKALAKLRKSLTEAEASVAAKASELLQSEAQFSKLKSAYDAKAEEVRATDELLSTLLTGGAGGDSDKGYMEQLQAAKKRVTQVTSEAQQAKLKLDHLGKQKKELESNVKQLEKNNKTLAAKHDTASQDLTAAQTKLSKIAFQPDREAALKRDRESLSKGVLDLRQRYDTLSDVMSRLKFVYSDPSPNFDRKRVHGLVANLITIPTDKMHNATAIEVAAGGRLYSVVVDTADVGTQLLEKGKLQKRVTIIPLNKIQSAPVDATRLAKAKSLAPGRVDLALSLVGYDKDIQAAMEFVFGSTVICADKDAAKAATFEAKLRSVTLEGDVYEPSGTLTGGSAPASGSILTQLQQLRAIKDELDQQEAALAKIEQDLAAISKASKTYHELKQTVELKEHEVSLIRKQLDDSPHGQTLKQLESIQAEVTQHQQTIDATQQREKEAQAECQRIEREIQELSDNRDGKLAALKSKLAKLKTELSNQSKAFKQEQQAIQTLQLEQKQAVDDVAQASEQFKTSEANLVVLCQQLNEQQQDLARLTDEFNQVKQAQQIEREKLSAYDEELASLKQHAKSRTDAINEAELEIKRLNLEISKFQKERHSAEGVIKSLEKQYEWIADQKQHFGVRGTAYDFGSQNAAEAKRRLEQLEETQSRLSKNVNRKVMNMIDRVEKEESALKKKLAIVLNDKKKIEDTISTLDVKKKEALHKTWQKVNQDFGAIFGDLLPSSSCKLEAPEGQEISDGLEIKVNLGGVWKSSLTELSGGQRSLVALSLILALLSFKPAPLYILDEIDAALDMSHTQNIGHLIKTRFKGAQFIIVSLKDGLFANANVLFKAKFRDGVSLVERHVQTKK